MRFGNVYKSFIYKVFTTHIFILQKKVSSLKIWKTVTYTEYYAHFFVPVRAISRPIAYPYITIQ